jgi:hypothetical protein
MLKPQDIVILLKILSTKTDKELSQNKLAMLLCMSPSEINAGIKRLMLSGLLALVSKKGKTTILPIKVACEECLIVGVKYFFPAEIGTYTRGIATSYAIPAFRKYLLLGADPIPVWPCAGGEKRGFALKPLYRSVPDSLIKYPDELFHELLALVDAIRSGRTRERTIATKLLKERLNKL